MPNRDPSTGRFISGSGSSGGFNLGTAFASIEINSDGVDAGIKKAKQTVSGGLKDIGASMQSIGATLTGIGAPFLALAAIGQNAFDQIDDAADQLGAVLKSTGGAAGVTKQSAIELSVELQKLTGITRAQILTGENMLLTFTNIGKDTFPRATKAITDLSVAMKQDIKSSAVQLGKALNDPIQGITALTRVGVTFSQSQKDMIKAMVEAGNVAGAQGVILTEIEKEFGGSAAAAADPIDHLRATLNDLAIDIGVSLQPVIEKMVPIIQEFAGQISHFLNVMIDNGDNTIGIILALGAGLVVLGPIIALVGTALTGLGAAFAVIFSPIGALIAAIVALFIAFQNNFLGIRDFLQPVFDSISNFFAHFTDNVKLYGSLIKLYAEYYFEGVVLAIQRVIDKVVEWIAQNPELLTMITVIGIAVGGLVLIMAAVPLVVGAITTATGLLTTALGFLLSPAVLLIGAIAGIVYVASQLYPGGLKQLFIDAQHAAIQLATLGLGVLAGAAVWAHDKLAALLEIISRIATGWNGIAGIVNLLSTGQVSLNDVLNAAGSGVGGTIQPVTAGSSMNSAAVNALAGRIGVQPIPPVGGGSAASQGFAAGSGGLNLSGSTFHINANSTAEGAAAAKGFQQQLEDTYRGRGN